MVCCIYENNFKGKKKVLPKGRVECVVRIERTLPNVFTVVELGSTSFAVPSTLPVIAGNAGQIRLSCRRSDYLAAGSPPRKARPY